MRYRSIHTIFCMIAGSIAGAGPVLVLDEALERELDPGASHAYALELHTEWFVSGRVDQRGVDVVVTVTGPSGAEAGRFDSPNGRFGPEFFHFTTDEAGAWTIEIAPGDEGGTGRYDIRLRRLEPVADSPEGKVDQLLATVFDDDTPGVVVGIVRDGTVEFVRAAGQADLAYGLPFTAETVTNIGSTSKQFLGFAMALLDRRGELSLDDDVRDYIPELPDFGETVTLRHLLTHTSGYREVYNTLALGGRRFMEGDYVDREEILEVIQRQPGLQNSPGTEWNYNNTGFGLLTLVVERVTGQGFPEWMREEVFEPLGMRSTRVRADSAEIIPNRSIGYRIGGGGFREGRDLGASMGAGGIYTTVGDMARWMANLNTFDHGGEEVGELLTTPFVLNGGEATGYGLGLFVEEHRGLKRWQHAGGDVAHRSSFQFYPELNAGFVVLTNHAAMPGIVPAGVATAFFGEHMEPEADEPQAAVDPGDPAAEDLERYAGRYELEAMPGFILTVSRQDGRLQVQATGQPAVELEPASGSTFRLKGVDASLTFQVEADGSVPELTLHQNGDHRAVRLEPHEMDVELAEYAGRYFSEELETFYDLAIEDGALVLKQRRLDPVTLTHAAGDRFTGSFPIATLEFERTGDGAVSGFRVGNVRARDIRFERVGPSS